MVRPSSRPRAHDSPAGNAADDGAAFMISVLIGFASSLAGAAAGAVGMWLWMTGREARDRRSVYAWLNSNTRDEPGESHVTAVVIAKGTGLPEERVRRACMTDIRVFRSDDGGEAWSIWRTEVESIYERRGMLVL